MPQPLESLVRKHGAETVSFHALAEGVRVWHHADGAVGYVDTGAAWVSVGAPLAPLPRCEQVAQHFVEAARGLSRRVCFCATERQFDVQSSFGSLQLGAQPTWDPANWSTKLMAPAARSLREQLRRARAKGVRVRLVEPRELLGGAPMSLKLSALTRRWLDGRGAAPLKFLLDVQLGAAPTEGRVYVAEVGDSMVGALGAVPIYGRSGWFFRDLLRDPLAPNGTTDLLVHAALTRAAEDGARHVTMGLVPLSGRVAWWLAAAGRLGSRYYDFGGLSRFRQRLLPDAWEPVSLKFPKAQLPLTALWDAATALMGRSPLAWLAASGSARSRRSDLQPHAEVPGSG